MVGYRRTKLCKPVTGKLNTFTNFCLKDLTWSDNDNNMYLGPVAVALQVLDPSPETSYTRKEKKGGGHIRNNQVFRSLNPRVYVSMRFSGVGLVFTVGKP